MENPYKVPDGVTLCPPGEAAGSHYLRQAPYSCAVDLTVRPRLLTPTFNQGKAPSWGWKGKRTVFLYNQELYVFYRELTPLIRAHNLWAYVFASIDNPRHPLWKVGENVRKHYYGLKE
jgi:hypothetical protein